MAASYLECPFCSIGMREALSVELGNSGFPNCLASVETCCWYWCSSSGSTLQNKKLKPSLIPLHSIRLLLARQLPKGSRQRTVSDQVGKTMPKELT